MFTSWKFGYQSVCFPEEEYNKELSECETDQDCKELFRDFKYPVDTIMVTLNKNNPFYEGIYELGEPWGGSPHWTNPQRTKHIFYPPGYWSFDNREQDPNDIHDYWNGGGFSSEDNSISGILNSRNSNYTIISI